MHRAGFAISAAVLAWGGSLSTFVARIIFPELVGTGGGCIEGVPGFECTLVLTLTVCTVTIHSTQENGQSIKDQNCFSQSLMCA